VARWLALVANAIERKKMKTHEISVMVMASSVI
jgi:hypothetical protein